jgi:choline dehydrogenase
MNDSFDYLILGGGTAGCIVAAELVAKNAGTVAVIEQGKTPIGPCIYRPSQYSRLFGSQWDESLTTTPQPNMRNRRLRWPRGKMLGGCTGINAMIYSRGSPRDFEHWPESWSYQRNLSAFEAIEQKLFAGKHLRTEAHRASASPSILPISELFLEAAWQFGLSRLEDDGLVATIGSCRYLQTQRHGRRLTAYDAFLKPMLHRDELVLFSRSRIDCITFENDQAVGIHASNERGSYQLRARRGVILCAGAIRSPELLLRSGIGPPEELKRCHLNVVVALEPVGRNLQDHLIYPLIYETDEEFSVDKRPAKEARLEYIQSRSGPIASNLAEVGAFLRLDSLDTSDKSPSFERPEVQFHFTPNHYLEFPVREQPKAAWSIGVGTLHPKSRGEVRLDQKPDSGLAIDPRYFSEDYDLDAMATAVFKAKAIAEQSVLRATAKSELLPGRERWGEAQLRKSIEMFSTTLFHPVGTCAVSTSSSTGVVDENLLVRGTRNLYVADASVIPTLPSANPQSVVMMVAWRLADYLTRLSATAS